MLAEHVRGDKEAEEQDQRRGDEQLRGQTAQTVVVNLSASRAAGRAASLDDRARAVCADQVLAAHLVCPFRKRYPGALGAIWGLSWPFPPRLFPGQTRLPISCPARP